MQVKGFQTWMLALQSVNFSCNGSRQYVHTKISRRNGSDGATIPIRTVFARLRALPDINLSRNHVPHEGFAPDETLASHLVTRNDAYLCLDFENQIVTPEMINLTSNDTNVASSERLRDHINEGSNKDTGPVYMDLGDCDQQCHHCGCLFWYAERLKGVRYNSRAEYHFCIPKQ